MSADTQYGQRYVDTLWFGDVFPGPLVCVWLFPANTFWMNLNIDCAPDLITQHQCSLFSSHMAEMFVIHIILAM